MEHQPTPLPDSQLRMVWPEPGTAPDEYLSSLLRAMEADPYPASRWEERFDICQMDAILHMLHHLTHRLPGFLRRYVLRRASRLPKLHGRFAPYNGHLGFHAEESAEVIGMSESWRVNEKGEQERLW
ncbi:MAG: hypothetical protein IPP83_03755 [Flavobacteriales bacterium]|nr:hypothetical protein [Flavobacteriales bacterium]